MKTAQKPKATTQKFIEIEDITDSIVTMSYGNACLIIEVKAINFSLLSKEEQEIKVLSYSSLLNSISFPIQIFVRSKKIDISSYLKLLDQEAVKSQNQLLKNQIMLYRDFVTELVKVNTVLDKKFYIIIPYSGLEGGSAKSKLSSKAEGLHAQLRRMGLGSKTLNNEELVALFHEIYNGDLEQINETAKDFRLSVTKAPNV
ncbi:MAG: hypothetical protein Q7R51_01125 [bacterium]|nr:hypothetical protein [bacterium]